MHDGARAIRNDTTCGTGGDAVEQGWHVDTTHGRGGDTMEQRWHDTTRGRVGGTMEQQHGVGDVKRACLLARLFSFIHELIIEPCFHRLIKNLNGQF